MAKSSQQQAKLQVHLSKEGVGNHIKLGSQYVPIASFALEADASKPVPWLVMRVPMLPELVEITTDDDLKSSKLVVPA